MKTGRNDSCPCGSGLKYKKCCLARDEDAARSLVSKAGNSKPPVESSALEWEEIRNELVRLIGANVSPDPDAEAIEARLTEFESRDYEAQVGQFEQDLRGPLPNRGDMFFDMLSTLREPALQRGQRERFESLLDALRDALPEDYERDKFFYLEWRVSDALAAGTLGSLANLPEMLAEAASVDTEQFEHCVEPLAYHGELEILAHSAARGLPGVKSSDRISRRDRLAYCRNAWFCTLLYQLEQGQSAEEAAAAVEFIGGSRQPPLADAARYAGHLQGGVERPWSRADFETAHRHRENGRDPWTENLFCLSLEFIGTLRREENVPYTRGELGRRQLHSYLDARRNEMREKEEEARQSANRRHPAAPPDGGRLLCPDEKTLDRYLATLFNFFNPQFYKVAALLEMLPPWLGFLERRGLVDAALRQTTLGKMRKLAEMSAYLLEFFHDDPAPATDLRRVIPQFSQ